MLTEEHSTEIVAYIERVLQDSHTRRLGVGHDDEGIPSLEAQ